jgi:hypothetical protein
LTNISASIIALGFFTGSLGTVAGGFFFGGSAIDAAIAAGSGGGGGTFGPGARRIKDKV